MKYLLVLGLLATLIGCQDTYRYPCQDPRNSHLAECSKEVCEITRECPERKGK